MSNEIKAASFRLIEEDILKFREIAEQNGLNQAEMFQALMNSFEMSRAKGEIKDRAKEIEVFQDTVNSLMGMFINSLAINQTSEERIRETLSLELNTKDKTIESLQNREKELNIKIKVLDESESKYMKMANELAVELENIKKEIDQKNNIIDNQQEQINALNEIVTEYKSYKDLYKELENKNNTLNTEITNTLHAKSDLESKIKNIENMKEFYKNEVEQLKNDIKELNNNIKDMDRINKEEIKTIESTHKAIELDYKEEIKAIELAHKEEIKELLANNKAEIAELKEELSNQFKEELVAKLEAEKAKYELQLDKCINREELLTMKYTNLKEEYEKISKDNKNDIIK